MDRNTGLGDSSGLKSVEELMVELQTELHAIARRQMANERANHTLQPTALVNEAFMKLCEQRNLRQVGRAAFLKAAAITMRRILIEHARKLKSLKRGGEHQRLTMSGHDPAAGQKAIDVLELEEALTKLSSHSERMGSVVTCRYFASMTMPEIAEALGVGLRTVEDDWAFAKAWLRLELERE